MPKMAKNDHFENKVVIGWSCQKCPIYAGLRAFFLKMTMTTSLEKFLKKLNFKKVFGKKGGHMFKK